MIKKKSGFTLIELLIVIAIIGILAAIALPQFSKYRKKAFCSTMLQDARNAQLALEAYFAENGVYVAEADMASPTKLKDFGFRGISKGYSATGATKKIDVDSDSTEFTLTMKDPKCSSKEFKLTSAGWDAGNGAPKTE